MEAAVEEKAPAKERSQFRQIGNSLGVIVPASVRRAGGFCAGDEVLLESPRPGVITISSVENAGRGKLQNWHELQAFILRNKRKGAAWPENKSFKEVLSDARDERLNF